MSIFSKLFRRRGRKQKKEERELSKLIQTFSDAWASVRFDSDAHAFSADAHQMMLRYVSDRSRSMKNRQEALKKVTGLLDSFSNTYKYTNKPIDADTAELLKYAIIGWTDDESKKLLSGMSDVIQALMLNINIDMPLDARKNIMAELLHCRNACALQLELEAYTTAQERTILGALEGLKRDIRGNVSAERIFDSIKELKAQLNETGKDVTYPEFENYEGFCKTLGAAIQAIRAMESDVERDLAKIAKEKDEVGETYLSEADNARKNALKSRLTSLMNKEKPVAERAAGLTSRENSLLILEEKIKKANDKTDLSKHPDFVKYFKDTDYRAILSQAKYDAIMCTLDTIIEEYADASSSFEDDVEDEVDAFLKAKAEQKRNEASQEQARSSHNVQ